NLVLRTKHHPHRRCRHRDRRRAKWITDKSYEWIIGKSYDNHIIREFSLNFGAEPIARFGVERVRRLHHLSSLLVGHLLVSTAVNVRKAGGLAATFKSSHLGSFTFILIIFTRGLGYDHRPVH